MGIPQGFRPLGCGPTGPGSGFSVMPFGPVRSHTDRNVHTSNIVSNDFAGYGFSKT